MTSNETKKQQAYDRLRRSSRATELLRGVLEASQMKIWRTFSLAQLINLLFLMHGDGGSTGNFNVSFVAALELVGANLICYEPETERATISQQVQ